MIVFAEVWAMARAMAAYFAWRLLVLVRVVLAMCSVHVVTAAVIIFMQA